MKLLMIAGASRSVLWFRKELISYLQNKGHEIVVIACDTDNQKEIESLGVSFYCAGSDNRDTGIISNLKYISTIKKLVKQINPDKIMTFQVKPNTFGIIGAKLAGYKDITAMIEGLGRVYNNDKNNLKSKIIKIITSTLYMFSLKKIPTVIFLNEDNKQQLLKSNTIKENQCLLIKGIGVDIKDFNFMNAFSEDVIKFVMVSRVDLDKGVYEYCEAAKVIKEKGYSNVSFEFYGSDDDKTILPKYKDVVNYKGYTNDVKSIYADNSIVVLPSYHEGVPRSLMEACACGKPIIATDIPGCRVCVTNDVNGKLVKVKSIEELVNSMIYFIEHKEQIEIMGKASRKIAEKDFDSDIINEQIYKRMFN